MNLHLAFAPQLASLAEANDDLELALDARHVDADSAGRARLVVEELACNAIAQAPRMPEDALLRLQVRIETERLWLRFRDPGPPFDPLQVPPPTLDLPPAERPVGGLGLYLVSCTADHIAYHHDGTDNVVEVILQRPHSPVDEVPR